MSLESHVQQAAYKLLLRHRFALAVIVIVTGIAVFGSELEQLLRYDRSAIATGEYWRLLSAHFVHLNWSHLAMNVAGFLLIWVLFGHLLSNWEWSLVLLLSCFGVSLGLLAWDPQLKWYVGFSGVLHAIIICACLFDLAKPHIDGKLLLFIIIAKLIYEQRVGPLPGSEATAGGAVIVDAHLYGAISGVFCAALLLMLRRALRRPP